MPLYASVAVNKGTNMEVKQADMLKSGVHFGHQTSRWHPNMKPYLFGERGGVHIIDLRQTQTKLAEAMAFASQLAKDKKTILFVGTKRQAKVIVKEAAEACGMPHLTERWIGGFLTNFPTVSRLMQRLRKLRSDKKSGALEKYKKHEQMAFDEEIERLEFLIGGVEFLEKTPDALFVVDIKKEGTAIKEAKKIGIPIIAIVDSNTNPLAVTHPIPGNDDATKSIKLITEAISSAIKEHPVQS